MIRWASDLHRVLPALLVPTAILSAPHVPIYQAEVEAASQSLPLAVDRQELRQREYRIVFSQHSLPLAVPRWIDQWELDWWSWTLELSEAQQAALAGFYDAYLIEDDDLRFRRLPGLWEESGRAAAMGPVANPEAAAAVARFHDHCERASHDLLMVEETFFAKIEAMLADVQIADLARVRAERERVRFTTAKHFVIQYPGADCDLSWLLFDLGVGRTIDPLDPNSFATVLRDYEQRATSLLRDQYEAILNMIKKHAELWPTISLASSFEQRQAARETLRETYRRATFAGKRIRELNIEYVDKFRHLLPSSTADELASTYNRLAYPPIYPNPFDISSAAEAMLDREGIDEAQRQATIAAVDQWREQERIISGSMVNRFVEWKSAYLLTRAFHSDEYAQYKDDMSKLQANRSRAARTALEILKGLVRADRDAAGSKEIDACLAKIESHHSEEFGSDYRP